MTVTVRYNGRSREVAFNRLDLALTASDQDLKRAVERALELPAQALADYEVDRYATAINVRPQARFG